MRTLIAALSILVISASGCNSNKKNDQSAVSPTPSFTPTPTPTLLNTSKIFENSPAPDMAYQLYRFLGTANLNVNFSPLSLKIAFSLIYPGAEGSTQKLLEKIFGFTPENTNPFHAEYELATKMAQLKSTGQQLIISNSAWMKNPKSIKDSFRDSLKIQDAEVGKLDIDAINDWSAKATHQKIPKLLQSMDPNLRAIFVNAIAFKQKWSTPFDLKETSTDHFQGSPYLSVNVPTLHGDQDVLYYENQNSKWIALTYADSPFQLLMALPIKRFDLKSLEDELSSTYLTALIAKMKQSKVKLAIPKFKFSQSASFKSLLSIVGYAELFTKANYAGISGSSFVLSDVIQAAAIEVNEEGTEASAGSAPMMIHKKMSKEPIFGKAFLADQPFLFILRNRETQEIYWMGKVVNPVLN